MATALAAGRFTPVDFAYNGRVAAALLPGLAVAAVYGGRSVVTLLALGAIGGYIMDLLGYRDGAYSASWLTLLATAPAFSVVVFVTVQASLMLQACLVFAVTAALALCAAWASLQFKFLQLQHPAVALAFERALLTGCLPAALSLHTLGLGLLVDPSDLPFYTAAIAACGYAAFGRPLPSSFTQRGPRGATGVGLPPGSRQHNTRSSGGGGGGGGGGQPCVQSRGDGALLAGLAVVAPPLLYAVIHADVLTLHWLHLHSLLLLGAAPLLLMCLLPDGLWWLPGPPRFQRTARGALTMIWFSAPPQAAGMVAAVVGFEGRVVFHAFGQYIRLPPPWNWAAVTACLLGVCALALAAQRGAVGGAIDITVAGKGTALLLCTAAGAVATGMPAQWLPAPLVAACGLALFFDSGSLREYIIFVAGAFVTGLWFVLQHFWFLEVTVGGLHLHALCKLALAGLLPALMVPGLVYAGAPPPALDVLTALQACLITVLEERLYVSSHSDWSAEAMYPAYLVAATSAAGIAAQRHLAAHGHTTPLGAWIGHAVYATKPIMLLLPEASLVLPTVLLVLAATAPVFLTPSGSQGQAAGLPRRRARIPVGVGVIHAVSVLTALGLARFAVFDVVQFVLSARPHEGLLLGALLLVAAAALAPLVRLCYPTHQLANRLLASLALAGLLLAVLQPPLPVAGGARCPRLPLALCPRLWDDRHVPLHDSEDEEVWAEGLARQHHWPRWLLFAALVIGAAAGVLGSSPALVQRSRTAPLMATAPRLLLGGLVGLLVGAYVALEVLPGQLVLQVLVLVSCMWLVALLCLLPVPAARGPIILPALATSWFLAFALTLLLQAGLSPPEPPEEMRRLFPDSQRQVQDELSHATRAALLALFGCEAALLALALKLQVDAALRDQAARPSTENGYDGDAQRHTGMPPLLPWSEAVGLGRSQDVLCSVLPLAPLARWSASFTRDGRGASMGLRLQRLEAAGLPWAPTLGTACALCAYGLCLSLNTLVTGGQPEGLFLAAPLLLLVQQDPLIAVGVTPARRYVLPFSATAGSLLLTCVSASLGMAYSGVVTTDGGLWAEGDGRWHPGAPGALIPLLSAHSATGRAVQQIGIACACLPAAISLTLAMWGSHALQSRALTWQGVLCMLTLLLSPQPAARYLVGLLGLGAAVHQLGVRHNRRAGAKVI